MTPDPSARRARPRWLAPALVALMAGLGLVAVRAWSDGGTRITADDFTARPSDAVLVDVRTEAEFASGHLAGAVHVNLFDDFEGRMAAFDRARPVYLYCGSGTRSGRAAARLERMGFRTVVNAGAFADLAAAGAEVVRP